MIKVGRKELLTEAIAKQICRMIERMPDANILVTWENVVAQSNKKFGHDFNRQLLSQKEWCGRKLIAEAFSVAKEVQKSKQNDSSPKYKTGSRALMQKRIADLESRNLALIEELEKVRSQQIDKLDIFLNSGCDLRKLLENAYEKT